MALEKELKEKSGVVSNYHKILNVEVNYILNECVIYVANYKDDTYREKEKNFEKLKESIKDLNDKYEAETDVDIKSALADKINEIEPNTLVDKVFYTNIEPIHLDYIPEDLSFSNLYKILSSLEVFESSKDV